MYDTSDPYRWKHTSSVRAREGYWPITDTDLFEGPNGPQMIYSSINSVVHLVNPLKNSVTPFDFSDSQLVQDNEEDSYMFGIWSVKFSGDGREVIAGTTKGGLCMYL